MRSRCHLPSPGRRHHVYEHNDIRKRAAAHRGACSGAAPFAPSPFARGDYGGTAVREFAVALDGGDGERSFQAFLATPEAPPLAELPDLGALLDDHARLEAMPPRASAAGSSSWPGQGRHPRPRLDRGARQLRLRDAPPDPVRRWFADRGVAATRPAHILTGYERDHPGESLLIAFSLARSPLRVFRIGLILSLLVIPKRDWLAAVRDLRQAYERGLRSSVSTSVRWRKLLPLRSTRSSGDSGSLRSSAHPEGLWHPAPTAGMGADRSSSRGAGSDVSSAAV